jgi:hypothetical protein
MVADVAETTYNVISTMSDYVTVFQISSGSTGLPFALMGLVPLIIGAILIAGKWRFHWRRPNWLFAVFSCAFGIIWIFFVGEILTKGSDSFTAFRTGQYSIVEGIVTDFHPMPYEGHDDECFTVEAQRFCYSDYVITSGFHNAASHGGPIRSGIHVRVGYLGPTILRLQIRKDEVITPAESASAAQSAQRQYTTKTANDPILQRSMTAFLFTTVCWALWWNLEWRRAMRFWVCPPNKQATVYLFRVFFALCLIGSLNSLVQQLQHHPLTGQNLGATLLVAAIMCGVVGTMTAFSVWIAERREQRGPIAKGTRNAHSADVTPKRPRSPDVGSVAPGAGHSR